MKRRVRLLLVAIMIVDPGLALEPALGAGVEKLAMMQPAVASPELLTTDLIFIHCCHSHPLPPYDGYCCHSGAVVVAPGAYYGPAGVVGTSRRVARRTGRRVSRRR